MSWLSHESVLMSVRQGKTLLLQLQPLEMLQPEQRPRRHYNPVTSLQPSPPPHHLLHAKPF